MCGNVWLTVAVEKVRKRWLEIHSEGINDKILRKNKHGRQGKESKESPNQLLRMMSILLEKERLRRKEICGGR